jgi:signal transduction histidine kinase
MRIVLIVLLLLPGSGLLAQQGMQIYTPANGLVDAKVTRIVQDKYGRLVFLTREGFSIFDGQRFRNYFKVADVEVGIVSEYVFLPDSTLWLTRFQGGGIRIDRDSVHFDARFLGGLLEIYHIAPIAPVDFIVLCNRGVFRVTNGDARPLRNSNPAFPDTLPNVSYAMVYGNRVLFGQNEADEAGYLFCYDLATERITDLIRNPNFNSFLRGSDGQLLIQYPRELLAVDSAAFAKGKLALKKSGYSPFLQELKSGDKFFIDNTLNAWLLQSGVLTKIGYPSGERTIINRNGEKISNAGYVFTDREQNNWLILNGLGVRKLIPANFEQLSSLGSYPLSTIVLGYRIPDKGLYINTPNNSFLLTEKGVQPLKRPPGSNGKFVVAWKSDTWLLDNPYTLQNSRGQKMSFVFNDSIKPNFQLSTKLSCDAQGNLMIGGNYFLLLTTDGRALSAALPFFSDNITTDNRGLYWVFTRSDQMACYKAESNRLVSLFSMRIPVRNIRCAMHYNGDTFLVGTRYDGLLLLKAGQGYCTEFNRLTREDGLSNNFILNMAKRSNNSIVVGTSSGFDIINIRNGETAIQKLSAVSNNYEPFYQLIPDGNRLYLISELSSGLFVYEDKRLSPQHYRPHAYIGAVFVNGRLVNKDEQRFIYRDNNFSFEVSAPSFIDNANVNFYFTLNTFNNDQPLINNSGRLDVNNLLPGEYRLQVRVVYPGNHYPDETLVYAFEIAPPFWKTWWFIMLTVLSVSGLMFAFFRSYFVQQLRKKAAALEKKQALEQERTRIATDMHDDFGASLSRIKFISEKMQLTQAANPDLKTDLTKISAYSDEMAQKMNEIVWALNQRFDSLEDLVSFCRAYTADFLQDKNITLRFNSVLDENVMIPGEVRRNIFLVLKEALTNVVRHAAATTLAIDFTRQAGILTVRISDNGRGINTNAIRPFANGLANMRKRIAEIGGELLIESANGTTVQIIL